MDESRVFQVPPAAAVFHVMEEYRVFPTPDWSFPRRLPSPPAAVVSHWLRGSGMQHVHEDVHEDEALNLEVYDTLTALEHEEESLLVRAGKIPTTVSSDTCRWILETDPAGTIHRQPGALRPQ